MSKIVEAWGIDKDYLTVIEAWCISRRFEVAKTDIFCTGGQASPFWHPWLPIELINELKEKEWIVNTGSRFSIEQPTKLLPAPVEPKTLPSA